MPNRVSHFLALVTIVLTVALASAAQTNAPAACPTINVTGPAGITNPGDSFHFTATIDKAPSNPIDYRWTVSTGSIVDGQGTDKIRVDVDWEAVDGITVTATVEVLGLAKECPNTYSETAGVSHTRGAAVLEDE